MKSHKKNDNSINELVFDDIEPLTREFKDVEFSELEITKVKELKKENERYLKDFNKLLDNISSTEDKQKSLWKQIFENATADRMNAYIIWYDLYEDVYGRPNEHALHGQNLSRYMERMSKANEQLLKLAEQVFAAEKKNDNLVVSDDDIYNTLEKEYEKNKN